MRRLRLIVAAAVGLLFPLGLALAVYVASAASLDERAGVRVGTQPLGRVTVTRTERAATTTDRTTTEDEDDDRSGKCDEPEHRSDPDCFGGAAATTDEDDGSGRGRGRGRGGDDSDSDDSSGSGSGSDSSGKGSGGDD